MAWIGNLYSIDGDLTDSIFRSLLHFQDKHKQKPSHVLLHPDLVGSIREVVKPFIVPDPTQNKTCYTILRRDTP